VIGLENGAETCVRTPKRATEY